MLRYAAIFLVLTLVMAFLGFAGIALAFAEIAKILFYLFLVLLVASLVGHYFRKTV